MGLEDLKAQLQLVLVLEWDVGIYNISCIGMISVSN